MTTPDPDDTSLFLRIVLPIIPWIVLFALIWFAMWLQARSFAKVFRRNAESLEAKLDAVIKAIERRNDGK